LIEIGVRIAAGGAGVVGPAPQRRLGAPAAGAGQAADGGGIDEAPGLEAGRAEFAPQVCVTARGRERDLAHAGGAEEVGECAHRGDGLGVRGERVVEIGADEGGGDPQAAEARIDDDARDAAEVEVDEPGVLRGVGVGEEAGPEQGPPAGVEDGARDDEDSRERVAVHCAHRALAGRGRAGAVVEPRERGVVGRRTGGDGDGAEHGRRQWWRDRSG